jgi:small subunit ribosomal protein S6
MSLYEATFIVRQDLPQSSVEEIAQTFEKVLKEGKGKLIKKEYWGLRDLAYKINKSKKGHYLFLGIDADADTVNELKRRASVNQDVVRQLIIKTEEIEKKDSIILRQNEGEQNEPR